MPTWISSHLTGSGSKGFAFSRKPFLDNVISNEQYFQMRDGLKQWHGDWFWYFIVRFLRICTGARVGELRQFRVCHVNAGYMDIISKGQKLRRIWIPQTLQRECAAWKDGAVSSDLLFSGKSNKAITSRGISLGLKRIALRYGIDQDVVYPHSFRHLFAKNFIANQSRHRPPCRPHGARKHRDNQNLSAAHCRRAACRSRQSY